MGMSDNFWNPLNSMLEVGNRLCANDSDEKLDNLKRALQTFVTYKNEQQFQKNKEVINLIDKVDSAVNDFINQFYKSEPAGDSIVSK